MGVVAPYAEAKRKVLQLILTDDIGDLFKIEGAEAEHCSAYECAVCTRTKSY